jgi:predicted permease
MSFVSDVRLALRLLWKDRAFTAAALLTLIVCIGANAAIFSIVDSVVLRPLPAPGADRLVNIFNSYPNAGATRGSDGVPDYFDRLRDLTVFEEQALYRREGVTLGGAQGAERLAAVRGTPSFYRIAGARPVAGRVFDESDGEPGKDLKAMLSYALWQRQFAGDRGVVGRQIRLSGRTFEIIGVVQPDFRFLWNDIGVWLPAAFTPEQKADSQRHSNNWQMIARLKPGATVEQAQQQLDALNARNDKRFPQFSQILKDAGFRSLAFDFQRDLVREVRPVLYLLWGGVLFVLLIGCVNIANLVLVRATGRVRELATRHALGADAGRIRRQLMTETTLLALAGGFGGLLVGRWLLGLVPALGLDDLPRGFEVRMGVETIAGAIGAALVVGILLGLVSSTRFTRTNVNAALREEGRSGTIGRRTSLARRALATAQVAIALVLLVGAGLLLASFRAALRSDLGFNPSGVVTGAINLPTVRYGDDASRAAMVDRLLASVRSIPAVAHAGVTGVLPLSGDSNDSVILPEGYVIKAGESLISPYAASVSPGYFEAMRIPLVQGRDFDGRDIASSVPVAIVDEKLAAKFWPGRDPLGRRMRLPQSAEDVVKPGPGTRWITVVGVVRNIQLTGVATGRTSVGAYYFPMAQVPDPGFSLVVRTGIAPEAITASLRAKLAEIDSELPLYNIRTMDELVEAALVARRVPMLLSMAFALVAVSLSAIGLYGVLSYTVAQRRREIGIRMALGSTARGVFRLVLADGARVIGFGMIAGLVGTYFVARAMTSMLYGVAPFDPRVMAAVVGLMALLGLAAVLIPARRAARVNPIVALTD